MKISGKRLILGFLLLSGIGSGGLAVATLVSGQSAETAFHEVFSNAQSVRITDRNGVPLSITYQNAWNTYDYMPLYHIPAFLKDAFIISEDKRFYSHHGVDWAARLSALKSNITAMDSVRGASTMSEQVVRMLHSRPRSLWSRWIEGVEAAELEQDIDKADIFEFYLNQVPYASNRRGVVQAARYYFNRDLSTLTKKEMLALVVLVRAPSAYDLYKNPGKIEAPLKRLADALKTAGKISAQDYEQIAQEKLRLEKPALPVDARHFARYVRLNMPPDQQAYRTTLDSSLQAQVQGILEARLKSLGPKNVQNAAALVVDHTNGDILVWAVASSGEGEAAAEIDSVVTPRQPGSTLKPFLYALALEKGWSAATILNDAPLTEAVGSGLHRFRNYSNTNYGPLTLREALGNSLNIPALLAIRFVGVGDFLTVLGDMGFDSLQLQSGFYDEGLALGNGEVTLLELAQAYSALANHGVLRPLRVVMGRNEEQKKVRLYSDESASLISNILSDPWARRMEFGAGSVLNLPVQTAVKTGTSTDYRDAWVVGYNDRYTVAIWMGNLDRVPMNDVTGSKGPALALRSVFALLNKSRNTRPLYLSPRLSSQKVCMRPEDENGVCPYYSEWFMPDSALQGLRVEEKSSGLELIRPTDGLQIAYDPRIPAAHQKFRFELQGLAPDQSVTWFLNDTLLGQGHAAQILWPVTQGKHALFLQVDNPDGTQKDIGPVKFVVK